MLARTKSSAITAIDARGIDVEVYVKTAQQPKFTVIGLGDNAVKEARDRVSSAIRQSGYYVPDYVLVNLAPAEMKKEGSSFDLAIALGVLLASGQVKLRDKTRRAFYGELSLDGRLKPLRGMVAMAISALQSGIQEIIVPVQNLKEARLIEGLQVVACQSLPELLKYLTLGEIPSYENNSEQSYVKPDYPKLSEVWGQHSAKRAMLIAASGAHNILMIGPPGCGKSMLASRFPSILPRMRRDEALEVIKIHSILGLSINSLLAGIRPFRSPHHVVSDIGLVGGGSVPRPGEISIAHRGVLFLDEFPEYRRTAIESLRAPLESGQVSITRAKSSVTFPADFQLIAAMNPCPCGRLGMRENPCMCSRNEIANYLAKLSEPILDRIDLHVELEAVPISEMLANSRSENSESENDLLSRVEEAHDKAVKRTGKLNAKLSNSEIKKYIKIDESAFKLLENATKKIGLSARAYMRVLKVSLTIADLENEGTIMSKHVAEALSFRGLERLKSYSRAEFARS